MGLGWGHLYHTGLTPGILEGTWDQGGITYHAYITLGSYLGHWNETGIRVKSLRSLLIDTFSTIMSIRVESLISHCVDTGNTGMKLGSGWDYLYHTGLTPEVLEWDWDHSGITYVAVGWHLENSKRLRSGWYHLCHTGLTPGELWCDWDNWGINYITLV